MGSGWFPALGKRPGQSGSMTVMLALRYLFARPGGGWSAQGLTTLARSELASVLGQHPDHPLIGL